MSFSESDPAHPEEQLASSALNTTAGNLVLAFLRTCPGLKGGAQPFSEGNSLAELRTIIFESQGLSKLIATHLLLEQVEYFFRADEQWTKTNLLEPLREKNREATLLWRAVAQGTRRHSTLKAIGSEFVARPTDTALSANTRKSLAFSVVLDALWRLEQASEPAFSNEEISQMLRRVSDEVRAHCASGVRRFLVENGRTATEDGKQIADFTRRYELFSVAIEPFLKNTWPQEIVLTSKGVSDAFASIPAAVMPNFCSVLGVVERYIVPFDCWSLYDFGVDLKERTVDCVTLDAFDTHEKCECFLKLLHLGIGEKLESVVPYDLSLALEKIKQIDPSLAKSVYFRRLVTLAR